jgi:protein-tyrosine-phosphatase
MVNMAIPDSPTAEQMLEEINRAIWAVASGGQSYRIGSRQLTRADLSMLQKMRADLQAQVAASESGEFLANTYVAVFDGR